MQFDQVQYYPRIDSVFPAVGSLAGGTQVTIAGGGFPMNESNVGVFIGGRQCTVTYSNLESIICNTTSASNATVASKVKINTYSVEAPTVVSEWLEVAELVYAAPRNSGSFCPAFITFSFKLNSCHEEMPDFGASLVFFCVHALRVGRQLDIRGINYSAQWFVLGI
jgi:hypothetical protein